MLRKQPEIKGFWGGPPHHQGPGPRQGRPQPCLGGIGAPLPGTRIRGGMESGAHTSHAPGGRPPHREPARFPAAVASPRCGALATSHWPLLTFRRTDHDHAHPEVHAVADAAEASPGRPGPPRICSSRRRYPGWGRGGEASPPNSATWDGPILLLLGRVLQEVMMLMNCGDSINE